MHFSSQVHRAKVGGRPVITNKGEKARSGLLTSQLSGPSS